MKRFFGGRVARQLGAGVCALLVAGVCRAAEIKIHNSAPFRSSAQTPGNSISLPLGNFRPTYPFGYGTGLYSTYGYAPYGYYPPGTTPYGLGFTSPPGPSSLNFSAGGNPSFGNSYSPYRYPTLGSGYTAGFQPAGNTSGTAYGGLSPFAGNPNPMSSGNIVIPGLAKSSDGGATGGAAGVALPALPALKPDVPAGGSSQDLASKFISFGDSDFRNRQYSDALNRYQSATRQFPTLADAWFRQGFALAALGSYEQSAAAIRRGLEAKPAWVDSNFRLNDLYGTAAAQKQSLLDRMTKASDAQPSNADLAFVTGVHLYWDGKPVQAATYFRRAAKAAGTDAGVKAFMGKMQ
jgi:hypothetical protein